MDIKPNLELDPPPYDETLAVVASEPSKPKTSDSLTFKWMAVASSALNFWCAIELVYSGRLLYYFPFFFVVTFFSFIFALATIFLKVENRQWLKKLWITPKTLTLGYCVLFPFWMAENTTFFLMGMFLIVLTIFGFQWLETEEEELKLKFVPKVEGRIVAFFYNDPKLFNLLRFVLLILAFLSYANHIKYDRLLLGDFTVVSASFYLMLILNSNKFESLVFGEIHIYLSVIITIATGAIVGGSALMTYAPPRYGPENLLSFSYILSCFNFLASALESYALIMLLNSDSHDDEYESFPDVEDQKKKLRSLPDAFDNPFFVDDNGKVV